MSSLAHAQDLSLDDFARLDDEQKVVFLDEHATEATTTSVQRSQPLVQQLMTEAVKIADVWYDTILEGPYALTGKPGVEETSALTVKDTVFAYRVTVAAPAIFTEGEFCTFNEETEEWSAECYNDSGIITQQVLYDFAGREIDDGSYAEFND